MSHECHKSIHDSFSLYVFEIATNFVLIIRIKRNKMIIKKVVRMGYPESMSLQDEL